jgi:hypothetical protein
MMFFPDLIASSLSSVNILSAGGQLISPWEVKSSTTTKLFWAYAIDAREHENAKIKTIKQFILTIEKQFASNHEYQLLHFK